MSAALTPVAAATAVSWLDSPFALTTFKDYAAATKHEEFWTLRALAERIRATTASEKEALPWLKLARFGDVRTDKNSLRHDANVQAISGIEGDYDGERITIAEAVERLEQQGIAALIYPSPSFTKDAPRWRALCPTSAELPPDRRRPMLGRLNGLLGGIFSRESWTLSQCYYFGSVNRNPWHRVELIDGTPIDLHDDLDQIWTGPGNTEGAGAPDKSGDEREIAELIRRVLTGEELHTTLCPLAARLIGRSVPAGTTAEILRGIMFA
jgi:hypothetical protein